MAAVGCAKDNGRMEGDECSEKEKELNNHCKRNGIHPDCFMSESTRDSLDSKFERQKRVNGTAKSVSDFFTKPSFIPTLRLRKGKNALEPTVPRKRLLRGESTELRLRCQDGGGRLLAAAAAGERAVAKGQCGCSEDVADLSPCKLANGPGLGPCGFGRSPTPSPSSSSSSSTQEVCAMTPSPPPGESGDEDLDDCAGSDTTSTPTPSPTPGEPGQGRRERRDSNGTAEGRGIPDTPISTAPCSPLPFPKFPLPPPNFHHDDSGSRGSPTSLYSSSSFSSSSSSSSSDIAFISPLSCIPSPAGSLMALFGDSACATSSQVSSSAQAAAHSHQGSNASLGNSIPPASGSTNSSSIKGSSHGYFHAIINKSASCSDIHFSVPSSSSLSSRSSTSSLSSGVSASKRRAVTAPSTPSGAGEDAEVACQWKDCGSLVSPADVLEHLRLAHVDPQKNSAEEKFVCAWASCKVAGRASCSMSWLERHVVAHGGRTPFKCIVPQCGARFPSEQALQRHVNGHFPKRSEGAGGGGGPGHGAGSGARGGRLGRGDGEASSRIVRKKNKLKRRRPQCVRSGDFFDNGIMDQLQQQLWDLTAATQLGLNGAPHHVTFHGSVKARRTDDSGKETLLVAWTPDDVLEEVWMAKNQVNANLQRTIPLTALPPTAVTDIHSSLYHSYRFRKYRRK